MGMMLSEKFDLNSVARLLELATVASKLIVVTVWVAVVVAVLVGVVVFVSVAVV